MHLVEFAKASGGASACVRIRAYACGGLGGRYVCLEGLVLLWARVCGDGDGDGECIFLCLAVSFLLFLGFFFSCVCSSAPNMESGYSRVPAHGSLSVSRMMVLFLVDM